MWPKGREADYVIINNMEAGRYGFPTEMVYDLLLCLFLAGMDSYPTADECRLFSVALTWAKHDVWIRVNPDNPSPFVEEFAKKEEDRGLVTGILQHRCKNRNEMKRFEYAISANGTITYNAPSGYHDDCVIALALANRYRQEYVFTGSMIPLARAHHQPLSTSSM